MEDLAAAVVGEVVLWIVRRRAVAFCLARHGAGGQG